MIDKLNNELNNELNYNLNSINKNKSKQHLNKKTLTNKKDLFHQNQIQKQFQNLLQKQLEQQLQKQLEQQLQELVL